MKRMMVAAMVAAVLALTGGTAMADWSAKSAFPKSEDPWRNWGKPHPNHHQVHPPRDYYVYPYYVWVPAYWWWNGTAWVLVPGYWRAL